MQMSKQIILKSQMTYFLEFALRKTFKTQLRRRVLKWKRQAQAPYPKFGIFVFGIAFLT